MSDKPKKSVSKQNEWVTNQRSSRVSTANNFVGDRPKNEKVVGDKPKKLRSVYKLFVGDEPKKLRRSINKLLWRWSGYGLEVTTEDVNADRRKTSARRS